MESLRDLVRPLRSLAPSELSPLGALTWQAAGVTLCSALGVLAFVGTISTAELGGAAMALSGLALVAWTAAAACYWAFWVVARRSLGSIERCDDRLDDQLVAALDAIRMKAVVEMSPEWKPARKVWCALVASSRTPYSLIARFQARRASRDLATRASAPFRPVGMTHGSSARAFQRRR